MRRPQLGALYHCNCKHRPFLTARCTRLSAQAQTCSLLKEAGVQSSLEALQDGVDCEQEGRRGCDLCIEGQVPLWATGAQFLWDLGGGSMHNKPGLCPKRPGSGGTVSGLFLGTSSPVRLCLVCVPGRCPGRRRPPGREKVVSCRCGRSRLCWPAE